MPFLFPIDNPLNVLSNSYVLAGLLISVFITALSYMAGEFFQMPSVKGFARVELSELGVTAVILIIAALLLTPGGIFDMVSRGFVVPDTVGSSGVPTKVCPEWLALHGDYNAATGNYEKGNIAFAQAHYFIGCRMPFWSIMGAASGGFLDFLWTGISHGIGDPLFGTDPDISPAINYGGRGIMMPRIMHGYIQLMWLEALFGFLSTLDFGFSWQAGGVAMLPTWISVTGVMPLIGISLISEANIFVADALSASWAALAAQKMLLQFIEGPLLVFFLPLGVFLRALPFSRKTGSTVLAIVFAAYFVFPISVLVSQLVYEAINNPPAHPLPPPQVGMCSAVGADCTLNSDCCSNKCRRDNSGNFVCMTPVTDFSEYQSVFSICKNLNPWEIHDDWQQQVQMREQEMEELQALQFEYSENPTRTDARTREGQEEIAELQEQYFGAPPPSGLTYLITHPLAFVRSAQKLTEEALIESAKYVALAVLFLVSEIVITLTLLKDFATLIGGESRIFGLSKLV